MTVNENKRPRGRSSLITAAATVALITISAIFLRQTGGSPETSAGEICSPETSSGEISSTEDRGRLYSEAVAKAAEDENWPRNESELIFAFWRSISEKDWERVAVLCPGSSRDDFIMYDKWTPQPATGIANPEPHPTNPDVVLWPVRVPFPGFPGKTLKMAVMKTEDGRLGIDGANTIWW